MLESRLDATRKPCPVEVYNLFDVFYDELHASLEHSTETLRRAIVDVQLPPVYFSHPVVVNAPVGTLVHPFAIYFDGVAFTRIDAVVSLCVYFLLSGRLHHVCNLRKSELCKCGCKGWHSYSSVWQWLAWNLSSLASGRRPTHRHDDINEAIDCSDPELGFRAAMLFLKMDMMELGTSMGLPSVSSGSWGCPVCDCTSENMLLIAGWSPISSPHVLSSHELYSQACADCEFDGTFNTAQHLALLKASLGYDVKRGRIVLIDLPTFGLLKYDRVEPTQAMPYETMVDTAVHPVTIRFWRRDNETRARHRNPIFNPDFGVTVDRSLVFDWLHTISLGPLQDLLKHLMAEFFIVDAWATGQSHFPTRISQSVSKIQAELFVWYGKESKAKRNWSRVQTLATSSFGTRQKPGFSLHGGEANGFLSFAAQVLLPKYGGQLEATARTSFERGAASLVTLMRLIKLYPIVFPTPALQDRQEP